MTNTQTHTAKTYKKTRGLETAPTIKKAMKIQARKYTASTCEGCDILNRSDKFTFLMGVDEEVTGGRIVYQRGAVTPTVEVYTIGNEKRPQTTRVFMALHCEDSAEIDPCAIIKRISQMQDPQTENVYHLLEIR